MKVFAIKEPFIGQVWQGGDNSFRITNLIISEDDAWVEYTNVKTLQEYSCRLEAFKHRFQPIVD